MGKLGGAALAVVAVALAAVAGPAYGQARWTDYDRPPEHEIVLERDVKITMRDGVVLSADVRRPAAPGRWPVILMQTPYNKGTGLFASNAEYFTRRGYATVIADVRGTGGSQGAWDSFGEAEQRDGYELVEWAASQPWSDGNVGLAGASYLGLNQILTAAQHPPHLKAIFPVIPMADAYRDITFSGGQVNVAFIPLWLGLVTATSLTPPSYALSGSNPEELRANLVRGLTTLLQHIGGAATFQAPTILNAILGGELAFDGPFWKARSPLEVADEVKVPAFIVGGLRDIFQRGEPLLYERIRRNAEARLLMGPWTHVEAAFGEGLPRDGVPALERIQLRWFDHWLKGIDTDVEAIPPVTQWIDGPDRYETQPDWPHPRIRPQRLYLRDGGRLSDDKPAGDESPEAFVQHPLSGICTLSTTQWTAGLLGALPCTDDNRDNEGGELVYTTPPLREPLKLSGPAVANIWASTTASDAVLSVRVTEVSPSGRSRQLSAGWLSASFRAVDERRSRWIGDRIMQPWHPFTRESVEPVPEGEPVKLAVEIFPLSAEVRRGHRLRITIGPSDFPHSLPPLPGLLRSLAGRVSILHDAERASHVDLPVLGSRCAKPPRRGRRGCRALYVPHLLRAERPPARRRTGR